MDSKTIYTRLNKVFRDVFDDDSINVTPKTTAKDIEDWDSLEHITLISPLKTLKIGTASNTSPSFPQLKESSR